MGLANFPPDVILIPQATGAKLVVEDFRIDRISKIGGEVAQQVSKNVNAKLSQRVAEYERKLVGKINRQLAKQKDEFRLSVADVMKSKWAKPLSGLIQQQATKPEHISDDQR